MKRMKLSMTELINKNKEELLKDQKLIEVIEKRIDKKIIVSNK